MDPLSDILSLLKPRSHVSAGFDAGNPWSVHYANLQEMIKCFAIVSGTCWLAVDGEKEAVALQAGDCFVLPTGRPFRLASDLSLPAVDSGAIFPPQREGGVVRLNAGGDCYMVGSGFVVGGRIRASCSSDCPPSCISAKRRIRLRCAGAWSA
jgi:mannose-6-phosphate isomerase-like protein (cupin superfamily)